MISQLSKNTDLIKDQPLTERGWRWTQQVTELSILEGTGSPEGVIEAQTTRLYMDDSAAAGSILYIKQLADISGDRTQGWKLV